MEGSHISRPPTSPTDGDDPCLTDVTDVAIDSVTLLICLCGLVGNGVVLWLLGFHIRKSPITVYIIELSGTDITFLLFTVIFTILYMVQNISCSVVFTLTFMIVIDRLLRYCYNVGLYLLMAISIESWVSILCPLCYSRHCSQRRSDVVCALLAMLSLILSLIVIVMCRSDDQEPCQRSVISIYAIHLLLFAAAMASFGTVLFIKVKCGSQEHQPRRIHVVVFLTVIIFLIFGVPLSIRNLLHLLSYKFVSSQVVFLLACISSSIKPLIYFLVGSCWRGCSLVSLRVSFQRVFEEPEENADCVNDPEMNTVVPAS